MIISGKSIDVTLAANNHATPSPVTTEHLPFLDWLRGLAILMVYVCHTLDYAYDLDKVRWAGMWPNWQLPPLVLALYPLQFGHLGVAMFFVVSGLCIQLSWRKLAHEPWLAFFNRRFFRIYPPYLLALGVFTLLPPFAVWPVNLAEWASHALMLHNLSPQMAWGINSSFWSIAVEWQLYWVFPGLVWLHNRVGKRTTLLVLLLIEAALRLWQGVGDAGIQPGPWFPLSMSPLGFWGSWSLGAWLADHWLDRRSTVFNRPVLGRWMIGLFALLTLVSLLNRITYPLAFLLAALTTTGWIARQFGKPTYQQPWLPLFAPVSAVGLVSYSLYLWHQPMVLRGLPWLATLAGQMFGQSVTQWLLSIPGKLSMAALLLPITLLIAAVSYQWLEPPSILLGKLVKNRAIRLRNQSPWQWVSVSSVAKIGSHNTTHLK